MHAALDGVEQHASTPRPFGVLGVTAQTNRLQCARRAVGELQDNFTHGQSAVFSVPSVRLGKRAQAAQVVVDRLFDRDPCDPSVAQVDSVSMHVVKVLMDEEESKAIRSRSPGRYASGRSAVIAVSIGTDSMDGFQAVAPASTTLVQ